MPSPPAPPPAIRPSSLVLVALALWLGVAAVVGFELWRERSQALEQAQQAAATLSAVLEENTARSFDGVDVALEGLAGWLGRGSFARHDAELRELMRMQLRHLPTVRALFVIGPDGFIQHDTDHPRTPDISLADRAYFRQYLEDGAIQHALSPALQCRSGTGWCVASTRRISGPDGSFRGIVVAAVQLDNISRLFHKLHLAPGQVMTLLQPDGRLIASFPPSDTNVGQAYAAPGVLEKSLPQQSAGVFRTAGAPLGYPRVVSFRRLDSQPLVVVLSTAESTVLAGWRRTAAGAAAALGLLAVLLALGARLLLQQQRQKARTLVHQAAEAEARALAEANAKFRTFFEQGCFLSCVLALDGTVLEANDAGLDACGYAREEVVGRTFWECAWWRQMNAGVSRLQEGFARAAGGDTFRCEAGYSLADGRQTLVDLVLSPIRDEQGRALLVAALGVDVTARKHTEEQLRTLAEELRQADRLKGEFLATLSHELRNVLGPIQNGMTILDRVDPHGPQAKRARELVFRQLGQMRHLVDELLDVSRLSSGKVRLEQERVDLRQLLALAADAAQAYMAGPGHHLECAAGGEPLPVDVDRTRILQVLANLLGNAAKYTPPGGQIRIRARREGQEAVVEVVDNGIGIPIGAQTRVFQMFEQVKGHLAHSQGGLGIGLALVQKLVALHGGHVQAHSEGAGRGSTFTIYLPLAQPAEADATRPVAGAGEVPV